MQLINKGHGNQLELGTSPLKIIPNNILAISISLKANSGIHYVTYFCLKSKKVYILKWNW